MKDFIAFTLRIDKELHEKLLQISEKDKRSLNSEILYILQRYLEEQKKTNN